MQQKEGIDKFIDEIAVIAVLYNTNFYDSDAYISLQKSLERLDPSLKLSYYIYDNSITADSENLEKFKADNIIYVNDPSNPGLSKPSNDGAILAKNNGKKWLLFTNPDTFYDVEYFSKLYRSYLENVQTELFSPILVSDQHIVSPADYKHFVGSSPKKVITGINDLHNKLILYSGMFITINAFERTGGFNNQIKLDFMDCYFSENYKNLYKTFFLLDVNCVHDLSSSEKNIEKVLRRFGFYCEGAYHFSKSMKETIQLFILCFLRALKLCYKFKTVRFIPVPFKKFF